MKLTPYQKLLKMGKEKVEEALSAPRAAAMRSKAASEIANLGVKMAEQETQIAELASVYPIDFDALIKAQDGLALDKRRQKQLETIVEEMFP